MFSSCNAGDKGNGQSRHTLRSVVVDKEHVKERWASEMTDKNKKKC